jgi:hypothetical protein
MGLHPLRDAARGCVIEADRDVEGVVAVEGVGAVDPFTRSIHQIALVMEFAGHLCGGGTGKKKRAYENKTHSNSTHDRLLNRFPQAEILHFFEIGCDPTTLTVFGL